MTIKSMFLARFFPVLHEQQDTIAFIQRVKRDAIASKRACAQASNPFRAVSGMEKEYDEAANTIRYCDRILEEVDRKPERERIARNLTRFVRDILNRFTLILLVLGFAGLWYIGFIYISVLLHIQAIYLNLAALLGAISMVLWNRKNHRK